MRNFTLGLFTLLFFSVASNAQLSCPTPGGMRANGINLNGSCFFFIQNAIPGSTVFIYNESGTVLNTNGTPASAVANTHGEVVVPFPCNQVPITSVLSILPNGQYCNIVSITNPVILPVKFSSFTSKLVSQGVLLQWSTSYELNNERYVIEKSTDGRNYAAIGETEGGENGLLTQLFNFTDASYTSGNIAYYRIRQVDIDGSSTYSKVVYVNTSRSAGQLKIFPNPFVNEIQLTGLSAADLNKGNVKLFNVAGQQINYEIVGTNAIRVDNAPAGVYVLSVNGMSYKLIKN